MLVILKSKSTDEQREQILRRVRQAGGTAELYVPREAVIVINGCPPSLGDEIGALPAVASVKRHAHGQWLCSRERQPEDTVVEIGGHRIGGTAAPVLMAGPCAVESREQLFRIAEQVKKAGAGLLRGGAFKPRTSPYSFQGLGERGLELLCQVRERFDLPIVTEMRDVGAMDLFVKYGVDLIQVGARNMQNFEMLRLVGQSGLPVLLKRNPACSIVEWLQAAEYILLEGNSQVVLCERGVLASRGAETRYQLDLAAVPIIKELSHLPVVVDPSHASGDRRWVPPLARAAIAAGASGLLIEVHHAAEEALCDGPQSISPATLLRLVENLQSHGYLPSKQRILGPTRLRLIESVP
ncbi:MAG: 3-deoxy-7-phosphoheptulonate synthase [Acidobacteriota bacterium]